jgi:hypothetical protein
MLLVSVRRTNDVSDGFAPRDLTWTGRLVRSVLCGQGQFGSLLSDQPGVANAALREESVPKTTIHAHRDSLQVRGRCHGRHAGLASPRILTILLSLKEISTGPRESLGGFPAAGPIRTGLTSQAIRPHRPLGTAQTWCSNRRTWISFLQRQYSIVHPLSTSALKDGAFRE